MMNVFLQFLIKGATKFKYDIFPVRIELFNLTEKATVIISSKLFEKTPIFIMRN